MACWFLFSDMALVFFVRIVWKDYGKAYEVHRITEVHVYFKLIIALLYGIKKHRPFISAR